MASFRKIGRNWYYRFTDGDGKQRERKRCPDRRETEGMASAAEAEAANIRHGYIDPKARGYRDHEARPVGDHLADWHAYLMGKGSTDKHANLSRNRVARLIELARARKVSDLNPSRIQAALRAVRDQGEVAPVGPPLHPRRQGVLAVAVARWPDQGRHPGPPDELEPRRRPPPRASGPDPRGAS